ncbi:MAG: acyl carrier protein [Eubacteriales bacterium]
MKEKLIKIIADYQSKDASEISSSATFEELGLDSLDTAELVMQIEDELGVSIELSAELNTIDKLAEYIESKQ